MALMETYQAELKLASQELFAKMTKTIRPPVPIAPPETDDNPVQPLFSPEADERNGGSGQSSTLNNAAPPRETT